MHVFHKQSGTFKEVKIAELKPRELTKSLAKRFGFDWKEELPYTIYKLSLVEDGSILGLMSLHIVKAERRAEIRLLESSFENVGKNKVYVGIAGCLIAYACKQAFRLGFGGFVSLIPKTELSRYYQETYKFFQMGRHLAIDGKEAYELIKKFLENE